DGLLQQRMLTDLKHFEGNAQAIRLVVKLLRLNLTYTQTAGLLKYVRPAYEPKPDKAAANHYLNKKPGFYLSEEAFVDELRRVLGMRPGTRHPVAYIMEAADDISYCLADIEDSVEKGILDIRQLADLLVKKFAVHHSPDAPIPGDADNMSFQRMVDYSLEKAEREPINKVSEFFIRLRVKMIHPLVQHAAQQFIDNLEAVHAGTLGRALMEDGSLPHAIVQTFKDVAMEWVFCHPEVETLELQGYRIIQGLLDFYAPLLRLPAEEFQALAEGRQAAAPHPQLLVRRLPSQQIKAYLEAMKGVAEDPLQRQWEFYHRCRMLQDFVSGMTDQHAQDEYRALSAL
ncbi:TPA: dGTPase, partial [Pseudomonas aeruginosa]